MGVITRQKRRAEMNEQDGRYEVWEDMGKLKRAILKLAAKVGEQERRIAELEKALAEAKALAVAA